MATKTILDTQGDPLTLTSWGLDVYGRTVWLCPHAAASLPLVQELAQRRGIHAGRLPIMQAYGAAAASAQTHKQGTAVDVGLTSRSLVAIFRAAGWQATWRRGPAYGQSSMDNHTHAALKCPCRAGADYQLTAVVDGYNGLGSTGRAGADYEARPAVWRDWRTGLDWLHSQLPTTTTEAEEMPLTESDVARVANAATTAALAQLLGRSGPTVAVALQSTYQMVRGLAASAGVDVDEAAIAADVAAAVGPLVRDAVVAAVAAGGTPEAIADAVLDRLAGAITGATS